MKEKLKSKKRKRNIFLMIIGVLACVILYGRYNFNTDKQHAIDVIALASLGNVKEAFDKMEEKESYTNPLIHFKFKNWKKKMVARFISHEEIIENTSGNKIIHDISTIYRNYWSEQLLKDKSEEKNDSVLYKNLVDYLLTNNLTRLSKDSLEKTIKNDSELKRIIEGEGFETRFIFRNGFQDLFIWDKGKSENYEVILPKDTIETKVVFIENYHIYGYDNFATFGKSIVGGWAMKETATLYCTKDIYDLNSEKFKISYLKHESIHFVDLNEYPNLSSTDLEYRAKLIELMYCTENTIYDIISDFNFGADSSNRSHSHPYANYILIKNLSKLLFNSDYESDEMKWKSISSEEINRVAKQLYEQNEKILFDDKNRKKVI